MIPGIWVRIQANDPYVRPNVALWNIHTLKLDVWAWHEVRRMMPAEAAERIAEAEGHIAQREREHRQEQFRILRDLLYRVSSITD